MRIETESDVRLDVSRYQWGTGSDATPVAGMSTPQLLGALHYCLDATAAMGGLGLHCTSRFEGAKVAGTSRYLWAHSSPARPTEALSRGELQQALCRVIDNLEELNQRIARLLQVAKAFGHGRPMPAFDGPVDVG